jgi:type I restriction enzyme S subunit
LVLEGAGQCAIFLCDDEPVTFESHVTRVRLDSKLADPAFYYYYLQSPHGKAVIRSIVEQGAGASGIRGSELKTLNVLWCPEKEQREIAKVLSILDDKIEMNRKATETLEAIAQAIFKSWFVSFDPVRAKAEGLKPEGMDASTAALFPCEFEASKYGASPKGWATIPLYEIADFQNGAAYRDIHFSDDDEGLPVIKIAELKSGVTASTRFTTSDLGEKYRIDQAEILFSWSGNPDTSIDAFVWVGGPAWLNQHIFRVRENGKASRARVYFQLKVLRPEFAEIARDKQTTGLGHVTIADMKRLMVCQPTTGVALEFDKIAGPIFERVVSNLLSIRILESLRDTLLPRLISGKLRVPDAEKMVEAVL